MLSARRKSDGLSVSAYMERRSCGPYSCLECGDPVVLKMGRKRINHFAHENPLACQYATGESDAHRRCKVEIYKTLLTAPNVTDVKLEWPFGNVRPDVSARIKGVQVAIEVQISSLSIETITRRTIDYARKGIYVLWLLPWTPDLHGKRYSPRNWERWVHAAYYGHIFYWIEGLTVACYHFEPSFQTVPQRTWYGKGGKKMTTGGYSRRAKRFRSPVRGEILNLAIDFEPTDRDWWEGGGLTLPFAKLFMGRYKAN